MSTAKCDIEPRPPSSRGRSARVGGGDAKRRRASSKKKNRRNDKPHRYPTRRELEGKNYAYLERRLEEVRAAEERTLRRYAQVQRAGRTDGEDDSELDGASTASRTADHSQQGSDTAAEQVRRVRCCAFAPLGSSCHLLISIFSVRTLCYIL